MHLVRRVTRAFTNALHGIRAALIFLFGGMVTASSK